MMWKVSVILPCYNGSRWIGSAIESVLGQTYPDFELVVVDDGSTDNSKEIVDSYVGDERVRYKHQKNRGFSAAINSGIRASRGELIGFIGQDDLWLNRKLELQVEYFKKHQYLDLVCSNNYIINSEDHVINVVDRIMPEDYSKERLINNLFLKNLLSFETVLVKKRCFDKVGLFDERMTGYSDHDIWLRIAWKFNIGYIDTPLVKKRVHEGQLSRVRVEAMIKDEFLLVKKAIRQYPFLKSQVRKKLSQLYYKWGMVLLQEGKEKEAKRKFIKSVRCRPLKLKSTAAYLAPVLYTVIWDRYRKTEPEVHRAFKWIEG